MGTIRGFLEPYFKLYRNPTGTFDYLLGFILVFGFAALAATILNNIFWGIYQLVIDDPTSFETYVICIGSELAAIQEPFTSKWIPSLVFAHWMMESDSTDVLRTNSISFAVMSGIPFAVSETLTKGLDFGRVGHLLYGFVIAYPVYRWWRSDAQRGFQGFAMGAGLFAGVALHYIWNDWLIYVLTGAPRTC